MELIDCKNIFITGVTGVVGGRILYEILATTKAKVYCLVRAEDTEKARIRIANMLAVYDPDSILYEQFESKVIPIIGDITRPKFGLNPEDYYQLVHQIDQVFHVAANVNLVASYKKLAEVNVQGTSEVIEFCLTGNIPMLHTSSYSVVGSKLLDEFTFKENDLDIGQSFDYQPYELTKINAEKLVHEGSKRGLKWVIVRLGDIFGDSKTGSYPLQGTTNRGIYYSIVKTIVETELFYFTEDFFYLTPVDYAAKASLYLGLNPSAYGQTFHIVNPDQRHFYEFVNLIIDFGYKVKVISIDLYLKLFQSNLILKEGKIYSSAFTSFILFLYFLFGSDLPPHCVMVFSGTKLDTSNAQKFLDKVGIICPNVDIKLISTYLNYCIKKGFIPSPNKQYSLSNQPQYNANYEGYLKNELKLIQAENLSTNISNTPNDYGLNQVSNSILEAEAEAATIQISNNSSNKYMEVALSNPIDKTEVAPSSSSPQEVHNYMDTSTILSSNGKHASKVTTLCQVLPKLKAVTITQENIPTSSTSNRTPKTAPVSTSPQDPPILENKSYSVEDNFTNVPSTAPAPIVNVLATDSINVIKFSTRLLEVISDKTGYPIDMLEMNMDLETDLEIDLIKRVEIFAVMQQEFPEIELDVKAIAELRSLTKVVNVLSSPGFSYFPS
ncbi:SDR family oxidoreductase [Nostoc sp. FACHB-892]|uniref:SDR family oxidoreductase n=1 Tax=Nostoc sp. FACHB-892 TaxID=2692843 RepID=UPI0016828BE3|nr:SDR family oxidoreductase [Nostoc sp. FACHB-892]MBD2730156.1 SDR family oxidoreductase [Nostoc sp. FACHB-892]